MFERKRDLKSLRFCICSKTHQQAVNYEKVHYYNTISTGVCLTNPGVDAIMPYANGRDLEGGTPE